MLTVGLALALEGAVDSMPEGVCEESSLGYKEGISLESTTIGAAEGVFDGLFDGATDGVDDTTSVGTALSAPEDGNALLDGIDETSSTVGVSETVLVGIEESIALGIPLG